MKTMKKRSWALALVLAMVCSLFTGISAKAEESHIFACYADWKDGKPLPSNDLNEYHDGVGMDLRSRRQLYFCMDNSSIEKVLETGIKADDISKFKVYEYNGAVKGEELTGVIKNCYDDNRETIDGVFEFFFNESGNYIVEYDENYIFFIDVFMPRMGVFDSDTFNEDSFLGSDDIKYFADPSETTYYLHISSPSEDSEIKSAVISNICAKEDINSEESVEIEEIKIEKIKTDESTYKITFPAFYDRGGYIKYDFKVEFNGEGGDTWEETGHRLWINNCKDGLAIAWTINQEVKWDDPDDSEEGETAHDYDTFLFDENPWHYNKIFNVGIMEYNQLSFGIIEDNDSVKAITDKTKLNIEKIFGSENADFEINNYFNTWSNSEGNDIEVYMTEDGTDTGAETGAYSVIFYDEGIYRVSYEGCDGYVYIKVGLPEVAVYTSAEASKETLAALSWNNIEYKNGNTYYIVASEEYKDRLRRECEYAEISFSDYLGHETIDWLKDDFKAEKFTIPATLSGYYGDSIWVDMNIISYDDNGEPIKDDKGNVETHSENRVFGLNQGPDGFVACNNWEKQNGEIIIENPSFGGFNRDGREEEIYADIYLNLGTMDDGTVTLLTKEQLDTVEIIDRSGKTVDSSIGTIEPVKASYYEDENKIDIYIAKIVMFREGEYALKYNDEVISYKTYTPDMLIYSKNSADAKYALGTGTEYNAKMNTFFILPNVKTLEKDGFSKTFKIFGATVKEENIYNEETDEWESTINDEDLDRIELKVDKINGIKVIIPEGVTGGFRVAVFYDRYETFKDENDELNPDIYRNNEQEFWFGVKDGEISYPDEIKDDVAKAEAASEIINALPAASEITSKNEAAVNAAKSAYDKLSADQKAIVDPDVKAKLEAAVSALEAAKAAEAKAAADAKKNEDAKNAAVKAAVDAANKSAAEKEAAAVAAANAKAAEDATTAKTAADAEMAAAVDAANAKAAADAAAAKTAADAEKAAAVEAAKAAAVKAPPVVNTVIYDSASKALYKVIKASDGKSAGEVEFKSADSMVKKMNIPESITVEGITYDVTAIGKNAFEGNSKMASVTIPSKVTKIGANAFLNCSKLKTIMVKSDVIKSVGKNALKGINKKAVIKVSKTKLKDYRKLFKKKGQKKSVKVK